MKFVFYFIITMGLIGLVFFGYFTLIDWAALRAAYAHFNQLTPSSSPQAILLADARQNIHRLNVFADGTWTLLSGIIATIGCNGLAILKRFT